MATISAITSAPATRIHHSVRYLRRARENQRKSGLSNVEFLTGTIEEIPLPDDRAVLGRMPGSKVPVIHQQWDESDPLPFWAGRRFSGNHLYDLQADPGEAQNLAGTPLEAAWP